MVHLILLNSFCLYCNYVCLSLELGQLCTKKIHNFFQENISENITPLCSTMPEIKIDLNGVLKLLSSLKPDKAAGPETVKDGDCSCYMPLV